MSCLAIRERVAGACRIICRCRVAFFVLAVALIAFIFAQTRARTDPPVTGLLPPGSQEMRTLKLLASGTEELRTVGNLLLSLQEPLRLSELGLLLRDLDKTESEIAMVATQTVEIALVECYAVALTVEQAWRVDSSEYQSLNAVFRGPEGLAKQALRRLTGTVTSRLERVNQAVKDEGASTSAEIYAIEAGGTRWLFRRKDQRPRLASLHQRHEGIRKALEGLQSVQALVIDRAMSGLKRYLKRVQATRNAGGGNAVVNQGGLRALCKAVERAMNGNN